MNKVMKGDSFGIFFSKCGKNNPWDCW